MAREDRLMLWIAKDIAPELGLPWATGPGKLHRANFDGRATANPCH